MPKDGILRSRFAQDAELNESTARFLADGQEKIAEAIEKVRRAGSAQTDDAVRQAEVQKRALGDLANAWDRVRNAVGAAISPAMVGIFDTLSGAAPEGKGKTFLEWLATDLTPSVGSAPPSTGGWADLMRGGGIVGDASMPPIGNGAPAPDRIRMTSGEFSPEFMDRLKSPGGMVFSGPAAMNKVFCPCV